MKDQRDIETTLDLTAFVAELRRLADALEADGTFSVELDGEIVEVPADAAFTIEHERDGGREELEFQMKWGVATAQTGDDDASNDADAEVTDADAAEQQAATDETPEVVATQDQPAEPAADDAAQPQAEAEPEQPDAEQKDR